MSGLPTSSKGKIISPGSRPVDIQLMKETFISNSSVGEYKVTITYFFRQQDSAMYQWQTTHIVNELAHHSITMDIVNPLNYNNLGEAYTSLFERIKETKSNLFLTCHNENLIPVSLLKEIKALGIPTALICFDNLLIPFEHKSVCSDYDIVWLTSKETEYLFKKWGANTVFLPYAANPYAFKFIARNEINRTVFIGTPYGSRANLINELTSENIPVSLYGKQSMNEGKHVLRKGLVTTLSEDLKFKIGRRLVAAAIKQRITPTAKLNIEANSLERKGFAEDMSEIYASYALAISSTSARNTGILTHPVEVINLRSFEIPMCGGIQFCKYNEELAGYFEDGKEIVFYSNHDEMIEKAKYYTSDRSLSERQLIRTAARRRAENDHTWFNRFNELFKRLGVELA